MIIGLRHIKRIEKDRKNGLAVCIRQRRHAHLLQGKL